VRECPSGPGTPGEGAETAEGGIRRSEVKQSFAAKLWFPSESLGTIKYFHKLFFK